MTLLMSPWPVMMMTRADEENHIWENRSENKNIKPALMRLNAQKRNLQQIHATQEAEISKLKLDRKKETKINPSNLANNENLFGNTKFSFTPLEIDKLHREEISQDLRQKLAEIQDEGHKTISEIRKKHSEILLNQMETKLLESIKALRLSIETQNKIKKTFPKKVSREKKTGFEISVENEKVTTCPKTPEPTEFQDFENIWICKYCQRTIPNKSKQKKRHREKCQKKFKNCNK